MEFRTYTMRPGTREAFVRFFETEAIPRMRAAGMTVLGQFSSVTDENVFAYARTFASVEERERQYQEFYGSEDWLGWMIDVATGQEESFAVFLGESALQPPVREGLSGAHNTQFTLASTHGLIVDIAEDTIVVVDEDGYESSFRVHPRVQVYFTPTARGPNPALVITLAQLQVGDRVLVLGSQGDDGAVARQIVKRPGGYDSS